MSSVAIKRGRLAVFLVVVWLGCAADSGAGGPGRAARTFYASLASGDVEAARAMALENAALTSLENRFGSLEAWGNRVTKNGIVSHCQAIDESQLADRARVTLLVLFNDGTRRRDDLELVRSEGRWRIDMATVRGAPSPPENRS